jgi:hypothetical protein
MTMTRKVVREFATFPAVVIAAFALRNAIVLIVLATFAAGALLRPY